MLSRRQFLQFTLANFGIQLPKLALHNKDFFRSRDWSAYRLFTYRHKRLFPVQTTICRVSKRLEWDCDTLEKHPYSITWLSDVSIGNQISLRNPNGQFSKIVNDTEFLLYYFLFQSPYLTLTLSADGYTEYINGVLQSDETT